MRLRTTLVISLAVAACCALAPAARVSSARARRGVSLLLVNGKVFTGDARGTIAQAVAVSGNHVVAVGTTREIDSRYAAARRVDLKGRLVTAGFNDAHLHFLNGGLALFRVDLNGAATLAEAKRRVAAKARELPEGAWILGRGWDNTLWGGQWPTKESLDEAAPRNPVFVQRVDGHTSWANSLALSKAEVTRATHDPDGGEIVRDARGEPTGILKETAGGLVARVVPAPTREEKMRAIERALAEARRYGITSVSDSISGYDSLALYQELLIRDRLTVRVAEWLNFQDSVETLKRQRAEFDALKINPARIRIGAVKGYVDGTLGSRTAAMLAPFDDDPHNSGIPRMTAEELNAKVSALDAAGFQITLHAIGDKANRMALDAYKLALDTNPRPPSDEKQTKEGKRTEGAKRDVGGPVSVFTTYDGDTFKKGEFTFSISYADYINYTTRHRVEHAQVVAPPDFARFRDLGIIASMQPSHAISDKRWAQARLGEYRVLGAYSWHTFMSHGVHVPFGTDWPIEPISPYLGLYAAVTRQSTDGEPAGGWWPEERISIEDAIRNYTAEGAYATFEEKAKGVIAAGMLADLVVHSKDLLTIAPREILNAQPDMTVFDGRVVYERQ
ncbi:MAG TPA: amidohydrolase [Pyrinomonadaceae bacterium]|nr:amidohydrolase [Pyrinomonadaceae bacterium]